MKFLSYYKGPFLLVRKKFQKVDTKTVQMTQNHGVTEDLSFEIIRIVKCRVKRN